MSTLLGLIVCIVIYMTIIAIPVLILLAILIVLRNVKGKRTHKYVAPRRIKSREEIWPNTNFYNESNYEHIQKNETSNTYIKTELITEYENKLYRILNEIIEENSYNNITILSKVRMADVIKTTTYSYADFNKIKSKHIDFVLCEKDNLTPILLIELDDSTHNTVERRTRDDFVNQSLVQAGYKILHIRNMDKNNISMMLKKILPGELAAVYYV